MATIAELQVRLEALHKLRASGHREVQFGEQRIQYRTDAELAAAIADLQHQLAGQGGQRVHTVLLSTSKGL